MGNKFLTLLSNMLTNLNLTDMETCYKAFRREVIQGIDLREDRFGFEPEIASKVSRLPGIRICEVPIWYHGLCFPIIIDISANPCLNNRRLWQRN